MSESAGSNSWSKHAYAKGWHPKAFSQLKGPHRCKICIIGAGLAGVSTAVSLFEQAEMDTVLLDQDQPGYGASGLNGGFVFSGYSRSLDWLIRNLGEKAGSDLFQLSLDGVDLIRKRAQKWSIDAEVEEAGVLLANWFRDDQSLMKLHENWQKFEQLNAEWMNETRLSKRLDTSLYYDGLWEKSALHFNPLRYLHGLLDQLSKHEIPIYGNSQVLQVQACGKHFEILTPQGKVIADKVLVSGGAYLEKLKPKTIRQSSLAIATYVAITEQVKDRLPRLFENKWAIYDTRYAFDYYRPVQNERLLWGGRISIHNPDVKKIESILYQDMLKVYPQLEGIKLEQAWSGWMSYARHQMPQIRQYQPNFWVAQGFGGHGMSVTTIAGESIAADMNGNKHMVELFSPFALSWAGGSVGRYVAQASYWYYQLRDQLKSLRR